MATPNQILMHGFPFGIFTFTYAISGSFATEALLKANEGFVVSLDTTAPGTVKLAADGDVIFGRIYVAEKRDVLGYNVASVARKFKEKVPANTGHGIVVGDRIIGAGAGKVKKDTAAAASNPIVVEVGTDYVVAEKL